LVGASALAVLHCAKGKMEGGRIWVRSHETEKKRVRYLQIWPPSRSAEEEATGAQTEASNTGT